MDLIFILLLSIFLILTRSGATAGCSDGWVAYTDDYHIKSFPDPLSYNEAISFCASQENSTLVTVKNVDMQRILSTYGTNIPDAFWIGAKFNRQSDQFVWEDGEPFMYTNWQPGYPVSIPVLDYCVEGLRKSSDSDRKWGNVAVSGKILRGSSKEPGRQNLEANWLNICKYIGY